MDQDLEHLITKLVYAANHLPVFPAGTDFNHLSDEVKKRIEDESEARFNLTQYISNNYKKDKK